jgi:uncharacterized membrane protein
MGKLQKYFLTGLLTLLPIWLVWVVFKFVFSALSGLSQPLIGPVVASIVAREPAMFGWLSANWIQTALALFVTVFFIVAVGALARRVVGQTLLRWFEAVIARIPLAKTVYGSARQLLDLLQSNRDGVQRVVLIDFPHKEIKSVGFVTRVLRDEDTGEELAAVYVPTTPNPTSGYLEVVPTAKLIFTDWSMDQAMTFIISGGAVSPEHIPFSRGTSA